MNLFTHRTFAAVASAAALCGFAAPVGAQSPGYGDPYRTVVAVAPSPYWGYTYNPYASYLHGAAEVTRANGDYFIKTQHAAQLREQVRQTKLETRRKQLEHWVWEREFKADADKRERERIHKDEIERARTLPPQKEILDAVSLNHILDELRQRPDLSREDSTKVETEWLAHIHVTVDGQANLGLLKDDRIFWPELLTRNDFVPVCDRINQLLMRAKEQALAPQTYPRVDPSVLGELRKNLDACKNHLDREWAKDAVDHDPAWNPRHFTQANRFLQEEMRDAIKALERPDAAMFFSPLRGSTVAELVDHMKKKGIRFAKATVGSESYYFALHRALARELTRLQEK